MYYPIQYLRDMNIKKKVYKLCDKSQKLASRRL